MRRYTVESRLLPAAAGRVSPGRFIVAGSGSASPRGYNSARAAAGQNAGAPSRARREPMGVGIWDGRSYETSGLSGGSSPSPIAGAAAATGAGASTIGGATAAATAGAVAGAAAGAAAVAAAEDPAYDQYLLPALGRLPSREGRGEMILGVLPAEYHNMPSPRTPGRGTSQLNLSRFCH